MESNKRIAALCGLAVTAGAIFMSVRSLRADAGWPPQLGRPFPDIALVDQTGRVVKMSSFKGKVILVEYIGMTCPACQAFTGAHDLGSFEKVNPQRGLESIEKLFPRYTGGLSLGDDRIVFVQILLYSMSMNAPTASDARKWARHFQLSRSNRQVVLAGKPELLGQDSYDLIPGFQLVDKNFVIRSDSTGHHPRHNLYTELLPMVSVILKEHAAMPKDSLLVTSAQSSDEVFAVADEETIQASYNHIPHRRTIFDVDAAGMSDDEKNTLHVFFRLIDLAIVERVQMTRWIMSGGQKGRAARHYDPILEKLDQLNSPPSLNDAKQFVISAIKEQRLFLDQWHKSGKKAFPQGDPLVLSASSKLHDAYRRLMKNFPQEGQQNKQAFFDYLCALDFI